MWKVKTYWSVMWPSQMSECPCILRIRNAGWKGGCSAPPWKRRNASRARSLMSAGSAAYASQKVWAGRNFIAGPAAPGDGQVCGALLFLPLRCPEIGLLGCHAQGIQDHFLGGSARRRATCQLCQGLTDNVFLIGWHSHDQLWPSGVGSIQPNVWLVTIGHAISLLSRTAGSYNHSVIIAWVRRL